MTTAAQVDKLYQKLTSEELAGLAFEALARQDGIELDTIVGNVKTQTYICKDWDYRWRFVGLTDLYKYYSMIYWKNRAYMANVDNFIKEGDVKLQNLLDRLIDETVAMDVALQDVCNKQGIDFMKVKKLALCENEATFTTSEKPDLVAEFVGLFEATLGKK